MIFKKKTELPKITLRNGAEVISGLEKSHREAERALDAAGMSLREARERYEAALDEGRDAALAAGQVVMAAEIDLEIARRSANALSDQVSAARTALERAAVEQKRSEAERLRAVFETTARQGLSRMGGEARSILRAWAEAELAIEEARQAQGRNEEPVPSAEDFRNISAIQERVVSRDHVTLWLRNGTDQPYSDELQKKIVIRGGKAFLQKEYGQGSELYHAGQFERITYAARVPAIRVLPLVESLSIPAIVGGGVPGWLPSDSVGSPHEVLARLAELERTPDQPQRTQELRVEDRFMHYINVAHVEGD